MSQIEIIKGDEIVIPVTWAGANGSPTGTTSFYASAEFSEIRDRSGSMEVARGASRCCRVWPHDR